MKRMQQPVFVEINLRPVRIGFLVDPADRATIGNAVRLATCLWGGTMCPLIPVMDTVPEPWLTHDVASTMHPTSPRTPEGLTRGHLETFEPDVLVETASGQLDRVRSTKIAPKFALRSGRMAELVRSADPWRAPYFDVGLGMDAIYEHLCRTEYQFQRREQPSVMLFAEGDGPSNSFFEVAYGMFPESERMRHFAESYRYSLNAETAPAGMDAWKRIESSGVRYPFSFSNLHVQGGINVGAPRLFVFDPCTGTDVIEFWNFRLSGNRVIPFNSRWAGDAKDFFWSTIRENDRPLPGAPDLRAGVILHYGRSADMGRVDRALDLACPEAPAGTMVIGGQWTLPYSAARGSQAGGPGPAMLSVKREEIRVGPICEPGPEARHHVLVPTLSPEFSAESNAGETAWVNVAQVRSRGEDTPFAELMPSAAFNDYTTAFTTRRHGRSRTHEGWVSFHGRPHRSGILPLPTMREAITGWLARQGLEPAPSDAGRVANDLIQSVGGIGRMALFADRGTIEFFDKMARSRHGRGGGEDEFPERTASIGQIRAFLEKRKQGRPSDRVDLNSFVAASALRLGVAVRCTHCTKENWYALDDLTYTNRCDRCLKSFDFPQGAIPRQSNWKYRVVGPFATPNFAQGAYSVALTLRFLKNSIASRGGFTFSTGVELKSGLQTRESDFFAWCRSLGGGRFPDLATVIGECKSLGSEAFAASDIERLKNLAGWFPGAFLTAATLKDSFDPGETTALRELAEWGWRLGRGRMTEPPSPLIVLTGRELMCATNHHDAWREAGGNFPELLKRYRGARNPVDLAKATQEAYLQFQSNEIFEMTASD